MKSSNPIGRAIVAVLFCGLSTGCIYEDMPPCGDGYGITIVNDWSKARNADPEGMAYMFFPKGEPGSWRFDFPGKRAGEVMLPKGVFNYVTYNDDTAGIDFVAEDGGYVFATSFEKTSPGGTETDGEPVMTAPDRLWGYGIRDVVVDDDGVEYGNHNHEDRVLVSYPSLLTPHYTIVARHVRNLHGVAGLFASISGQSRGVWVNTGIRSDESVAVAFEPKIEPDSTLHASFYTFGLPSADSPKSIVSFFFRLSDGRKVEFRKDVTKEILSSPDPLDVTLVVDSISLPWAPPAEITGGAFDPTVEGWVEISINY